MKIKAGKRFRNEDGASLMAALLFFVLCGIGASVILAAASATSGKMEQVPAADRKRFAVESAASFLRDELQDAKNRITVREVLVEDSRKEDPVSDTVTFSMAGNRSGTDSANSILESYVRKLYEPMGNADPGGDASDRDLSMSVKASKGTTEADQEELKTTVHVSMDSGYGITAVVSDAATPADHPEDLCSRILTVPAVTNTDSSVSVENHVEKDADGNITDEWTITTTTLTTTIRWERGTIRRK